MNTVFEHKIRVRYGECDRMGFVHHSVYALYYEEARTEIMRNLGIAYHALEDDGYLMPVRSMDIRFLKAARYDDLVTVKVRLEEMPRVRCRFTYEVYNQHGDLLNTASTELFFVKKEGLKPTQLPAKWMELFEKAFKH